jgi:BirA family biotin operon repressor/biotin-[acetyl-CoA-carboxylase] ligase
MSAEGSSDFDGFAQEIERRMCPPQENLLVLKRADSTNSLARRVVSEYAAEDLRPPRLWIFAFEQSAGRGRQGRAWSSPAGLGVYATLCLGQIDRGGLETLPLLVAESLCATVNQWLGGRCRLKWPNDLVIGGLKLGGILIESVMRGDRPAAAIVGFGVNHGDDDAAPRGGQSTSLQREGAPPLSLAATAAALALGLERALEGRPEPAVVAARYAALSSHAPGDEVRCRIADGAVVEGAFAGFDDRGFLRLATAEGERRIAAGEVIES